MSQASAPVIGRKHGLVIAGSSVGTVFEWYDFFLYGALASVITKHFFSGVPETTGYILALLAFAAGFAVRPFGALVFGRLGDLWGRKNTFLVTMGLMGVSTFVVGLLPSFEQVGVLAPIALVAMRLLQGLALGGEYGGAAIYVAEHAPANKRGLFTSWIQTTATLGLFLSLMVILLVRTQLGETSFDAWGWRIPFLVSVVLLAASMWIRARLSESPVFQQMIDEGRTSKRPLAEALGSWRNLKLILIVLFGMAAAQAVTWYTGQFYALFFLERVLKVDGALTNILVGIALALGAPFFIVFGWLSDRIGRKWIIIAGCLIAALAYFPLFHELTAAANPRLAAAAANQPVAVVADPDDCAFQFDPIGKSTFTSSCDVAKAYLAKAGITYENKAAPRGSLARVEIGRQSIDSFNGAGMDKKAFKTKSEAWGKTTGATLKAAGYPARADPAQIDRPRVIVVLWLLMVIAAMIYGPIAAMLVELFPARIRYTSMSLPYHIGNGWFGGFLPTTAFAMSAATGDIYYGLWYPVVVAAVAVVVGGLFLRDTKGVDVSA